MIMSPGYAQTDQWQVQIQAQIALRARVLVKADGLSPNELREAHVEPVTDLDAALSDALIAAGPEATLCVLPQGPQTIPYLANE
jgi:lactate racemase